MDTLLKPLLLLPWPDWLALALFFGGWVGYARWAKQRADRTPSILATTNQWRRRWMLQATFRENRIVDSAVAQSLSASPSFFASTSILIIGGLLAALGATDKASGLVQEIPFAARTSALVFDLKLVLLTAIFVHAFFRFTWSLRQYSFGAIMVGAAPESKQFMAAEDQRAAWADPAGRVMGLAAETFNDGLRTYYMSFAAMAWFFSAWAFMAATAAVLVVLYRREFHSEVLAALREGLAPMPPAQAPSPDSPGSPPLPPSTG
ncbi:MAG TPA: DUF599 domain-containing protein [Aquabacterium sp.]|nr:DUF599 domain-containing protein [Aquabacterium sp.]HQC96780.1 DUF599 domain-containing protein [Aquabacterium sp.]